MRTKTKRCGLLAAITTAFACLCIAAGGIGICAKGVVASAAETLMPGKEWTKIAGGIGAEYDSLGYYTFNGTAGWDSYAMYNRKVKLEGLKVEVVLDEPVVDTVFGFGFVKSAADAATQKPYEENEIFTAAVWPGLFTQTRVHVGQSHNYNNASIAKKTDALGDGNGFMHDKTYVLNYDGNKTAFAYTFHKVEGKEVYKVTISDVVNPFSAGEVSEFYFDAKYVAKVLDGNGETHVAAFGANGAKGSIKFVDTEDATRVTAATTAQEAYQTAIENITDASSVQASLTKRAEFVDAVAELYEYQRAPYNAKLEELNGMYTSDAAVQATIRGIVEESFAATDRKIDALKAAAAPAEAQIAEAKALVSDEQAAYDELEGMLTQANKDGFTTRRAAHEAEIARAELKVVYNAHKDADSETYTAESWTPFATALTGAAASIASDTATAEELSGAKAALTEAALSLVRAPVDKTALETAYEANKDKVKAEYTAESWAPFNQALQTAVKLLKSKLATQKEVNAAVTELTSAAEGLAKVPTGNGGNAGGNESNDKKGGCGGSAVGASVAASVLILTAALVLALDKKRASQVKR